MCDNATATRTAARAYLTARWNEEVRPTIHADAITLKIYLSANVKTLVGRDCQTFDCTAGHTLYRVCPGCTYVGGPISREACSEHTPERDTYMCGFQPGNPIHRLRTV